MTQCRLLRSRCLRADACLRNAKTFSKVAVIAPHDGMPTLTLRLANVRRNQILEAQVSVTLVRDERTAEGEWMRRFYDLQLARHRSPIFAMTFTVMH